MSKDELLGLIEDYGYHKKNEGGWGVHHPNLVLHYQRQADEVKKQIEQVLSQLYVRAGHSAIGEDKH